MTEQLFIKFAGGEPYNIHIPVARVPVKGDIMELHDYRAHVHVPSSPAYFEVTSVIHSVTISGDDQADLYPVEVLGRRLTNREALAAKGIKV